MESKKSCTCGPECKCTSCDGTTACCGVATVRKPAPLFEAMSWNNGFKKIKLADYKGTRHI